MELKQLGPYRIGTRIGKGGMGDVYEAVHQDSGQVVAVKALSPQLAMAEGFRERFEAEIESLKKLQHDAIVRMFGYGEDQGTLFYSMERVNGPSLEDAITGGRRFDWRETIDLAIQICRALKHAHDHGVVHRDIKPANILLTPEGRVKLADFGIARLFGATQLTTAGGVLGTADYMSPEQADGRPVTDKCDQYALGCVMYALLAGRPPFRAKTMPEMLQMQRYAEPESVRRYAPATPVQLDKLLQQLLSKDPDERFPNVLVLGRHMEAMAKALSRKAAEQGEEATQEPVDATSASSRDTQTAEPISLITVNTGQEAIFDAPTLAEGAASPSDATAPVAAAPVAEDSVEPPPASRFTTVAEESRRAMHDDEHPWAHWLSLAGLVGALALLVFFGYRAMRPATADELYDDVAAAIAEDRTEGLRATRDEIEEFLERFPQDARATELNGYQQELQLLGIASRLRVNAKLRGDERTEPTARWYAAAMAVREADPAAARAMLANLLQLYGVDPQGAGEDRFDAPGLSLTKIERRWLRVADLELQRLRETLAGEADAQLPQLHARLAAAQRLAETDPVAATRIYHGVVELYADQPWATAIVRQAADELEQLTE